MTTSCTYNDQRSEDYYWQKHEIACNELQVKYPKFFKQNHCDFFNFYLNSLFMKKEEKVDIFVIYSTSLFCKFFFLIILQFNLISMGSNDVPHLWIIFVYYAFGFNILRRTVHEMGEIYYRLYWFQKHIYTKWLLWSFPHIDFFTKVT